MVVRYLVCSLLSTLYLACFVLTRPLLASRRSSNASEKKRDKSSARSKSPFRSFRFKKSKPAAATSGHYSDDEENLRDLGKSYGSSVAVGVFMYYISTLNTPVYVALILTGHGSLLIVVEF